jgi:hypothetical protein
MSWQGWLGLWMAIISVPSQALSPEPYLQGDSEQLIPPKTLESEYQDDHYTAQTSVNQAALDRSKDWLAGYLNRLSGNIDSFFVDSFFSEDITDDDVKGSRAKLSLYTRRVLGDPVDYKFGLSVKLVLPNTNERLNLLLDSEDGDNREADPIESVENVDYTAALRFIIRESDQWKTNIDAGVRWGVPPNPFVRFRARRYAYLSEWELKATQTFFYFSLDGWGEETRVQMDYPINTEKLFRINAKAGYQLNDEYFKLSYDAGLYHELSSKAALGFVAGAKGDSEFDTTFYSYNAGVRYRRQIYSNWVFAEVAPEFIWNRDKDYATTPVIMFRLESVIARDR